jgi:CSLREA domain-containing protein
MMIKRKFKPFLILLPALTLLLSGYLPASAAREAGTQISVTTVQDELNADGDCSLREAVQAANTDGAVDACPAGSGSDTISIPAGEYILSLAGTEENGNQKGDLDISEDLILLGAGPESTVIDGGGIDRVFHIQGASTVQIESLAVQNGYVSYWDLAGGGGIYNGEGSELALRKVIVQNNRTTRAGGGLENAGTANVNDALFRGNQANSGGSFFNTGTIFLERVTSSGNTAYSGGGLDDRNLAWLTNVTFSGDAATEGDEIFSDGDELTIVSSTIVASSAGVMNNGNVVKFKNTILVNSEGGAICAGSGSFASLGHNLENGNSCSFDQESDLVSTDPLLDPLAENEGFTLTHALLAGSPAIDRGDNLDCPETDQRGATRPADGDLNGGKTCDIGAFEFAGSFPTPVFMPMVLTRLVR